jgi:replicative DNA helicase
LTRPTLFDKAPPQDTHAEKCLLGSICCDPGVYDEVSPVISAECFYLQSHQVIYKAIQRLRDQNSTLDVITLSDELERCHELHEVGGDSYLTEIMNAVPWAHDGKRYAEIVREKWAKRTLIYTSTELLRRAFDDSDPAEEILNEAHESLSKLHESHTVEDEKTFYDYVIDVHDRIGREVQSGLMTGFRDLDDVTGGLQNKTLNLLAARPSVGKTALAYTILRKASETGWVVFFSLEQSSLEIAERALSGESGIENRLLRIGQVDNWGRDQVMRSLATLKECKIIVNDKPDLTLSQIRSLTRMHKRKHGIVLMVVDYLQCITPDNLKESTVQQVSRIARGLKAIAKECDIPVLALAQLNRAIEKRDDKRPKLSDLDNAGEKDADLVMFLDRPHLYDNNSDPSLAILTIGKHRNGETRELKLKWDGKTTTFSDSESSGDHNGLSAFTAWSDHALPEEGF